MRSLLSLRWSVFQFTHPVWGATPDNRIFSYEGEFQFTHPVWGATPDNRIFSYEGEFQFTHPVWGATEEGTKDARGLSVSIHAPRVGCD